VALLFMVHYVPRSRLRSMAYRRLPSRHRRDHDQGRIYMLLPYLYTSKFRTPDGLDAVRTLRVLGSTSHWFYSANAAR